MNEVKEANRMPKPIPPELAKQTPGVPSEMGQSLSSEDMFLDNVSQAWINHFQEQYGKVDHSKIIDMVEDLYGRIEEMYRPKTFGNE